jgi:hypothetical protein
MSPVSRRPVIASRSLAEQLRPIVYVHESVRTRLAAPIDVGAARARIRSGRPGLDVEEVLTGAGDLTGLFLRTAAAFEGTGVATTPQRAALQSGSIDPTALVFGWARGDSRPPAKNRALLLARQVAAVVGNAILSRASHDVLDGLTLTGWHRTQCPCCGALPDLALTMGRRRMLVCWRCDAMWGTDQRGCLGCGADAPPTLVRVPSPVLGYELAICNACGRYLKERRGAPTHALIVERALTAGLDEAAQQRGLRA